MRTLRSLISLEIEDEKKTCNSPQNQSYHQLLPTPHSFQMQTSTKLFSYSSINLKHGQTDLDSSSDDLENEEIALHFPSNSFVDLALPYEPLSQTRFEFDTDIELSMDCSQTDFIISDSESDHYGQTMGAEIDLEIFPMEEFKFMYQIGYGSFGIVRKAFHLKSCQIVAIKECRSNSNTALESFAKEIKICKEFQECPYIIDMIDSGLCKTQNSIFIALEYMNMSSFDKNKYILHCKNDSLQQIRHISFCVLRALDRLHSKLYVHNDLKPANILFADNGEIRLSDFGCIEQMKDSNTPLTNHSGTEYYQSFEKRFLSPIMYTTKSDIYSFGVTICELLQENLNKNHNIPFQISDEIIQRYGKTETVFLDFLNKCLDRDCEKRWSAKQLLAHPFLNKDGHSDTYDISVEPMNADIDDLEFVVKSLADYYTRYKHNKVCESVVTPIDNALTDGQRLENIAQCCGCSVQFVKDFIFQNVQKVKDKYLKM